MKKLTAESISTDEFMRWSRWLRQYGFRLCIAHHDGMIFPIDLREISTGRYLGPSQKVESSQRTKKEGA